MGFIWSQAGVTFLTVLLWAKQQGQAEEDVLWKAVGLFIEIFFFLCQAVTDEYSHTHREHAPGIDWSPLAAEVLMHRHCGAVLLSGKNHCQMLSSGECSWSVGWLTVSVHMLVLVMVQRRGEKSTHLFKTLVEVGWQFSLRCLVRMWWVSRSISLCLSAPAIWTLICLEIANLSSESTSWAAGKQRWPYLDLHGRLLKSCDLLLC